MGLESSIKLLGRTRTWKSQLSYDSEQLPHGKWTLSWEEGVFKWPSQPSCLWERRGLGILNQGPLGGKRTCKSQPSCFNEQLPLGEKGLSWKKGKLASYQVV